MSSSLRSAAPTMKPARSYSPAAYMPGISAVSPPIRAHPFFLQPRAIPETQWRDLCVELSDGEIVEEKERLRTLHRDVVYAVVDQILAYGIVAAGRKGDFELGATPSAELTRTGSCQPFKWKPAPKLPIDVRTFGVRVFRASRLISDTARPASSMFTPASR